MKHCVGSYSSRVAQGGYLVYSITKGGQRSSTLGIDINKGNHDKLPKKVYSFSQHYKHCNEYVTCGYEREFANKIIDLLNTDKGKVLKVCP